MTQLTMLEVKNFIATLFSSDSSLIKSNSIDRNKPTSIGVFSAPESRASRTETYGGQTCATTALFPVNILVRWTEDSDACEKKANEIYKRLCNVGQNFRIRTNDNNSAKIAFIKMLDSAPVGLGRDKDNVCEYSIRIDIFYYI